MKPDLHSCFRVGLALILSLGLAESSVAEGIRFEREADTIFLHGGDVAKQLNFEFKVVTPHRLATFCETGEGGICIPVRLNNENHRGADDDTLVSADVLARAIQIRVTDLGKQVTIAREALLPAGRAPGPAPYNTAWGKDRGFRKGDTLPDIPLVNLSGDEVRFSQFLGKRYILYCWASW